MAGLAAARILVDLDISLEFEVGDTLDFTEFEVGAELSSQRREVT